jgi:crotonobetainyl-CoA:carnitine CoA-transferase CaiB-like acyl-CoA transferase
VQIATGIGWASSPDGQRPGALPCQLLDHASGYLVAAGALRAAAIRARAGTASHVAVSLARTAGWLLDQGARATTPVGRLDVDPYRTPLGDGWTSISPPGHIDGEALAWPRLPPRYGGTRLPQPPATWL